VAEDTVSRRERLEQRVGRVVGGLSLLWYGLVEVELFVGFCGILLFAASVVL